MFNSSRLIPSNYEPRFCIKTFKTQFNVSILCPQLRECLLFIGDLGEPHCGHPFSVASDRNLISG